MADEKEQRMWRRLLAELHPDVGGDPELFVFASNLRDEMLGMHKPPNYCKDRVTPTGNLPLDMWTIYLRMWKECLKTRYKNSKPL